MGGSVSITNACENKKEDIWTELSVGYPYHFNSVGHDETVKLNCGMVWLSVKVTAFRDDSRDKAQERLVKGRWMIAKGALAMTTLGVTILEDVIGFTELFTGDLGVDVADVGGEGLTELEADGMAETEADGIAADDAEGERGPAERSAASDEENKKAANNVWKWITRAAGGLVFMDVGRGTGTKSRGVTFVVGHIRRGVYAGSQPTFKVVSETYRWDSDAPPVDRVDKDTWKEFKKLRKFEELVLLTLVDCPA